MDVLSEVLKAVKLDGALFFNGEFTAPWCLSSSRSTDMAPYLAPRGGHLILYHFLTEGRAYARLPDGGREELAAGDVVIFPHGDAHFLGNGSPERPVDSLRTFSKNLTEGLKLARFGGGGEITRFVCGFMACEPRLSEVFLSGLPKMLKVPVANAPSGQWLENTIRFLVCEENGSDAGSELVLSRLSEVLFVETLRGYIASLPAEQTGWLAGARDGEVGKALALMHRNPERPWTLAVLAQEAGISRSVLAERFRHYLNETPMAYLTHWRLQMGAQMLSGTNYSVAQIAAEVGYESEAAFNRAFKREFTVPPARFRANARSQKGKTAAAGKT